jgi:hypothetical protein
MTAVGRPPLLIFLPKVSNMRNETRTTNKQHAAAGVIRKTSISKRRRRGHEILTISFPRYPCHCPHIRSWAFGSIPKTGNFCTFYPHLKTVRLNMNHLRGPRSTEFQFRHPSFTKRNDNSGNGTLQCKGVQSQCNQGAKRVQTFAPAHPLMKMVRNGTPLPKNGTAPSHFSLLRSQISDLRSPATLSSVEEWYKTVRFSPKWYGLHPRPAYPRTRHSL